MLVYMDFYFAFGVSSFEIFHKQACLFFSVILHIQWSLSFALVYCLTFFNKNYDTFDRDVKKAKSQLVDQTSDRNKFTQSNLIPISEPERTQYQET
jgi:hypothetical protein